jgi:hypothetical protein
MSLDKLKDRMINSFAAYEACKAAYHEALRTEMEGSPDAPKAHRGWPKGKKRGPKAKVASKQSASVPANGASTAKSTTGRKLKGAAWRKPGNGVKRANDAALEAALDNEVLGEPA